MTIAFIALLISIGFGVQGLDEGHGDVARFAKSHCKNITGEQCAEKVSNMDKILAEERQRQWDENPITRHLTN